MTDYDLCDIIFDTLETASCAAMHHYDNGDMQDAAAILSEWTDTSDQCVLTHYLNDTTETLTKELLYITIDEAQREFGMGEFTFVPEPIDQ